MRNFLIHLDSYPYFRLPTKDEIDLMDNTTQKNYYHIVSNNILNETLWTEIFFKMKSININNKNINYLLSDVLDSTTGKINYPSEFMNDIFLKNKSILNNKIKDLCLEPNKTCTTYSKAQQAIEDIKILIHKNTTDIDLANKLLNFLSNLEYAMRSIL